MVSTVLSNRSLLRHQRRLFAASTDEAIRIGVFGSPTYLVDGELFYGQDRLMFVERHLERPFGTAQR